MKLGEKIYELRKRDGLSQEQLAEKEELNVTRQTISNWELGQTVPDINQAKALANIFKISLDELTNNEMKDILVEKINSTHELTEKMIKLLKILLVLIICFLILGIIFTTMYKIKSDQRTKLEEKLLFQSQSQKIYCTVDNKEYGYEIFYDVFYNFNGYNVWYISENVTAEEMEIIDFEDYKDVRQLMKDLKKYCEDNGGIYKEVE